MNLRILIILIWCVVPRLLLGAEKSSVRLFAGDMQIVLRESAKPKIESLLVTLVQSSNFHSGPDDKSHVFTAAEVQQGYRDVVARGEYLLMRFSPAKKLNTVGGEITVTEVIIGLRGPNSSDTVFTIDDHGTVVGHAKYSGEIYLELNKAVAIARE